MRFPFRPDKGLIFVDATLRGPKGEAVLRLALDTGASRTLITSPTMVRLGYSPAMAFEWVEVTTATKDELVPVVAVHAIESLGICKTSFGVLCHPLPPGATIDGLLGLDFLRGSILTIDFPAALLTLQA